jgi:hypothetical protein
MDAICKSNFNSIVQKRVDFPGFLRNDGATHSREIMDPGVFVLYMSTGFASSFVEQQK